MYVVNCSVRQTVVKGKIQIGTSGWHYDHWRGNFYPESLSKREWLDYYAQQFPCVELNNSFYRLPAAGTIEGWCKQTPASFTFVVKASRLITHMKKLHECEEAFARFYDVIKNFGKKLGPILFQLPPHWSANADRLDTFLRILPAGQQSVFEFRDPGWYCDAIYQLLEKHNAALCLSDFDGVTDPDVVTADFLYVRLHGPAGDYRGSYRPEALKDWASRIRQWQSRDKDVYLFFNNDEAAYAANNAAELTRLCLA